MPRVTNLHRPPQPDSVPMAIRVGARWRELETAAVTAAESLITTSGTPFPGWWPNQKGN